MSFIFIKIMIILINYFDEPLKVIKWLLNIIIPKKTEFCSKSFVKRDDLLLLSK